MKRFSYLVVVLVILASVIPQPAVGMLKQAVSKLGPSVLKQASTKFGPLSRAVSAFHFGTSKSGGGSWKEKKPDKYQPFKNTIVKDKDKDRSVEPLEKKMMVPLKVLPETLYRFQTKLPVALRDYDTQKSKGSKSYDVVLHSGEVVPSEIGKLYVGTPNGMSLRPMGKIMIALLQSFQGDIQVFELPKGTKLPERLVLFNEYNDHYSLQPRVPMSLADFNARLTDFLEQFESVPRKTFLASVEK